MRNTQAILTLENAGKHLVRTRHLENSVRSLNATAAAKDSNPDIQAFAVLSVLLARIVGRDDAEWVGEICRDLSLGGAA